MRLGYCSEETEAALQACHMSRKPMPSDGILPTKLYCLNKAVDMENAERLANLAGEATLFRGRDHFMRREGDGRQILDAMEKKAVAELQLKLGAQVILIKNWPEKQLVNGSRGVVMRYEEHLCSGYGVAEDKYVCPVVRFDSGQRLVIKPTSFFQVTQWMRAHEATHSALESNPTSLSL